MESTKIKAGHWVIPLVILMFAVIYYCNVKTGFTVVNVGYPTVGKVVSIYETSDIRKNKKRLVYNYIYGGDEIQAVKYVPDSVIRQSDDIVGKYFLVFYEECKNKTPKTYIFLNCPVNSFDENEIRIARRK